MSETLYATATTGSLRLKVPVGEVETPDGTVFDTTIRPHTFRMSKEQKRQLERLSVEQVTPGIKSIRAKRKRERLNKKRGRR